MKAKFVFLLVIVAQSFLYSCATAKGPLFKEVPLEAHKDKAVVYFFRNSQPHSIFTYDLRINGGNILPLPNKGYYLFILDPGEYKFTVSHTSELMANTLLLAESTLTLQGNREYYIRFHADVTGVIRQLFATRTVVSYGIMSVPRDEALEALRECRRILEEKYRKNQGHFPYFLQFAGNPGTSMISNVKGKTEISPDLPD